MDAFGVRNRVIGDYESFVKSFMDIADPRVKEKVDSEISDGLLWPQPWLALNPSFQSGGTISDLVNDDLLHPDCTDIFRRRTQTDPAGTELRLHQHQRDAVVIAARGESYVLTTGTGSGKSLSYIVPIVDRVLRYGGGKGVQAIVVYPMNALANSQLGELEKFLGKQAPKVTYQRYTGQEDRKTREGILANPPDVLLTNYVMLELLLTRPNERKALIESAKNLRFLVLDELRSTEAGRAPTSPCSSGGCAVPSVPTSRCSASERPPRSQDRGPRLRSALRLRTLPPACSGRPLTRTTSWGRPSSGPRAARPTRQSCGRA